MLRALALALTFGLLASGVAAAEKRESVGLDRHVAEKLLLANERLAESRYDDALEIVDALAKRRRLGPPELAQIHRFRGYIHVNQGRSEQAAAEFEKALAQRALDGVAEQAMTYSLAQIHTQLGNYPRALELIEVWFQGSESPKPEAFYLKAMILVQQQKYREAVEPARAAVERSPAPKESWLQLLVAIHGQLRDFPNVAETLARLVEIAPHKKLYWVQLAAVEHHLERDQKALARMRLAERAALLSEDTELRQLARLLYLQELPFECAQVIESGLGGGRVAPDADAFGLLANCYLAAREAERALEPLARAAELSPDGELYLLLGQLHLQNERWEPALDALAKSLAKAKPERRGAVQLMIGVAQLGSERFEEAERAFRAAQGDAKLRKAAESYLRFVDERRAVKQQQEALRTASLH